MLFKEDRRAVGADLPALGVLVQISEWASWKAHSRSFGGRTFFLARGELVTTERALMASLGVKSRSVIRRCLAALERLGIIRTQAHKEGTVIALVRAQRDLESDHPAQAESPVLEGMQVPEIADETTDEPRQKKGGKKIHKSPPSARARASGREEEVDLSQDETKAVAHAQRRLARIVPGKEILKFTLCWRELPQVSLAEVLRRIDWIASHPLARRDTKSISRIFHEKIARDSYARWDANCARFFRDELRSRSPEAIVQECVEHMTTCDSETVRLWAEDQITKLQPLGAAL